MLTILSVTSETHRLKGMRNGALLKEQVWFEDDKVVGYSLAYIDAALSSVSVPSPLPLSIPVLSLGSRGTRSCRRENPQRKCRLLPPILEFPYKSVCEAISRGRTYTVDAPKSILARRRSIVAATCSPEKYPQSDVLFSTL